MKKSSKAEKIILHCPFPLGDIVLLTAAVRDLHLNYPNRFITDVRTSFPELWENNPYITPIKDNERNVQRIYCHFPLINKSNATPHHVIHGFVHFLNQTLSLNVELSSFKGDIHLSAEEKQWESQIAECIGSEIPFWIVVAGGKTDVTIKWWELKRYQKVIDLYKNRIQFVQVGDLQHHHPTLTGVVDLRGKTNVRQLVRLVYHSQGVLCPITSLMHLAAAVEVKPGMPKNRACVVIAGGREPSQWEAYPHHQFIHTNGALFCCDNGGCWKSRVRPLGDGDERDEAQNLCVDVSGKLPRCMAMITAAEVIRRINSYFIGGALRFLSAAEQKLAKRAVYSGDQCRWDKKTMEHLAFRSGSENFIRQIPEYPDSFAGSGIVICAGGKYLICAWVCVNMLRRLGCRLPIEIWHLGDKELNPSVCRLFEHKNVVFVDALRMKETRPVRLLHGWCLKAYSILNSRFKKVLLLDADNIPVRNPKYLFGSKQFNRSGAIFWPDFGRMMRNNPIWDICGVDYRDECEFESGQIMVDKSKCWKALALALWYNEHSDFYYNYMLGDKDTFHMAFRKLNQVYSMPSTPIWPLEGVMCQHDFNGRRIFQHRNLRKWSLNMENPKTVGFMYEKECKGYLSQLRRQLDPEVLRDIESTGDWFCKKVVDNLAAEYWDAQLDVQIRKCNDTLWNGFGGCVTGDVFDATGVAG